MTADLPVAPRLHVLGATSGASERCMVWDLPESTVSLSSAVLGGGRRGVRWVVNLTVPPDYERTDPDAHLREVATAAGLSGAGVGLMTAVDVGACTTAVVGGARVDATVGVRRPVWAASPAAGVGRARVEHLDGHDRGDRAAPTGGVLRPGTINLIVQSPVALDDAALVNAVVTVTEAKVQALLDTGVDGTGTASDAVCVLCPADGPLERFGGPRSTWGARFADAAYEAIVEGVHRQRGASA